MNRKLITLLVLGSIALVTGCVNKQLAIDSLETMKAAIHERETKASAVLEKSISAYFEHVEGELERELELRRAKAKLAIHEKADERIKQVTTSSLDQLDGALEGPIERLDAALKEEQAKVASGGGSTAREHELALQLATTLMAHSRETVKLSEEIRDKFAAARDRALDRADESFDEAAKSAVIDIDPEAEAKKIIEAASDDIEKYQTAIDHNIDQLVRHLEKSSNPIKPFLKGLIGNDFGATLAGLLSDRATELLDKGREFVEGKLEDAVSSFEERLADEAESSR